MPITDLHGHRVPSPRENGSHAGHAVVHDHTTVLTVYSSGLAGSGYGRCYAKRVSRESREADPEADEGFPTPTHKARNLLALMPPGAPPVQSAATGEDDANEDDSGRVDLILLFSKCFVPALFVSVAGALAIPANRFMTDMIRQATREVAGGALIVTYAFELTKGYTLHGKDGEYSRALILWSFFGTLASCQIQAAAQGMWPYGSAGSSHVENEGPHGWGDAVPFAFGFFVDGVVLAYDTPPPPTNDHATDDIAVGDARARGDSDENGATMVRHHRARGRGCCPSCMRQCWHRVSPALSVLTFVVSVDNLVDGVGMLQQLDTSVIPAWAYYAIFALAIYLGGAVTACVRRIPSEGVQAAWFAFGAFSILDGGLELANSGLTNWVMLGFMGVWCLLLVG